MISRCLLLALAVIVSTPARPDVRLMSSSRWHLLVLSAHWAENWREWLLSVASRCRSLLGGTGLLHSPHRSLPVEIQRVTGYHLQLCLTSAISRYRLLALAGTVFTPARPDVWLMSSSRWLLSHLAHSLWLRFGGSGLSLIHLDILFFLRGDWASALAAALAASYLACRDSASHRVPSTAVPDIRDSTISLARTCRYCLQDGAP